MTSLSTQNSKREKIPTFLILTALEYREPFDIFVNNVLYATSNSKIVELGEFNENVVDFERRRRNFVRAISLIPFVSKIIDRLVGVS